MHVNKHEKMSHRPKESVNGPVSGSRLDAVLAAGLARTAPTDAPTPQPSTPEPKRAMPTPIKKDSSKPKPSTPTVSPEFLKFQGLTQEAELNAVVLAFESADKLLPIAGGVHGSNLVLAVAVNRFLEQFEIMDTATADAFEEMAYPYAVWLELMEEEGLLDGITFEDGPAETGSIYRDNPDLGQRPKMAFNDVAVEDLFAEYTKDILTCVDYGTNKRNFKGVLQTLSAIAPSVLGLMVNQIIPGLGVGSTIGGWTDNIVPRLQTAFDRAWSRPGFRQMFSYYPATRESLVDGAIDAIADSDSSWGALYDTFSWSDSEFHVSPLKSIFKVLWRAEMVVPPAMRFAYYLIGLVLRIAVRVVEFQLDSLTRWVDLNKTSVGRAWHTELLADLNELPDRTLFNRRQPRGDNLQAAVQKNRDEMTADLASALERWEENGPKLETHINKRPSRGTRAGGAGYAADAMAGTLKMVAGALRLDGAMAQLALTARNLPYVVAVMQWKSKAKTLVNRIEMSIDDFNDIAASIAEAQQIRDAQGVAPPPPRPQPRARGRRRPARPRPRRDRRRIDDAV